MKLLSALMVAFGLMFSLAAPASAEARVGLLTCRVSGGEGHIVGSVQDARCVFVGGGRQERYVAQYRRTGLDIGVRKPGVLTWAVFAPSSSIGRRALRGNYVGASADASFLVGGGANVLVGGNNRTISLQPLSLSAHEGVNLAVGVGEFLLR